MTEGDDGARELTAGLESTARVAGFHDARVKGCRRLSGGASKESWAFDLLSDGVERRLVLRRASPVARFEAAGTITLATEARLMRLARQAEVPVPAVAFELPPGCPLGEGFAMERIEGESVGSRVLRSDALAAVRPELARQCGAILARIHTIRAEQAPELDRFAPHEAIADLAARYHATRQMRPVFDWALRWLEDNVPADGPMALLHGDFRNGNLIIGPGGVHAVLDWETSHVGHPAEDLGWLCVNSWRFGEYGKPVGGFGTAEDLLAGYREAGGAAVTLEELHLWQVYGTLRWGVMCAEVGMRFAQGVRSVEGGMIARRASETEFDLVTLLAGSERDAG